MHDHAHDHARPAALSVSAQHRWRLTVVLALVIVMLVVEVVVALTTGSLALLSDAAHLATDVVGLSLAWVAITFAASRAPTHRSTFGWHRLEIVAALANAVLLLGVAAFVLVDAVRRLRAPVEVEPVPLLIVGAVALTIEIFCVWLLRVGAKESLNLEGARLEVLADAVATIGVLVAGAVIALTGWHLIDSLVAVAIAVWLVPRALRLGRRSLRVLLQHTPEGVDLEVLERELTALPGVTGIHDLHVWTLTSGMDVASVHVAVSDPASQHDVRHAAQAVIAERTGIDHSTVQLELADDPDCCEDHPRGW